MKPNLTNKVYIEKIFNKDVKTNNINIVIICIFFIFNFQIFRKEEM